MLSQQLRTLFIEYFVKNNHTWKPSISVVPEQDEKSILFVNAGMNAYKDIFSGHKKATEPCVVSIQRCLRAGGKHNDLDNVGYTARHQTFFEMLGNFSFGAYFKDEAIQLAWNFLTNVLKLPPEKLWVTVFEEDKETEKIWLEKIQVNPARLSRCGKQDNFWAMGETGPCGPCTEIFYDYGPSVPGGPPGTEDADGDRYVEIWNLVFIEYERTAEQSFVQLATPGVDTGMGLERLAAVMQGVQSNYETDLFKPLMQAVTDLMPLGQNRRIQTIQVIADHIRAISFLIFDGIVPGNEGRAYVLRRIIRRALRHGYQSGLKEPFLNKLICVFVQQMHIIYPTLQAAQQHITQIVLLEEQQFLKTLHRGLQYLEQALSTFKGQTLPGSLVFKLYDTYGFPADLTADLAKEYGLQWDQVEFEKGMHAQQKRSKQASSFKNILMPTMQFTSDFTGYKNLQSQGHIIALFNQDNQLVTQLNAGTQGSIILNTTPFYAEAGGQIGDQGTLIDADNLFDVTDTQKQDTLHRHIGQVKAGLFKLHQDVQAIVNIKRRKAITQHHTATHLLHATLRKKLNADITQKGSLVTASYLRFDFNYFESITQFHITMIEYCINQIIWENLKVDTQLMSFESAQKIGAIALFSEKYQASVRVLNIGDFSTELCGGTHVAYTGELGLFKIIATSTVASGIKRIEALVGEAAFNYVQQLTQQQKEMAVLLKTDTQNIIHRLTKHTETLKEQTSHIKELELHLLQNTQQDLIKKTIQIDNIHLVVSEIPSFLATQARLLVEQLKASIPNPAIVILGGLHAGKIEISIGISKNYTMHISSKAFIELLSPLIQGKGGGRPDFARLCSVSQDSNTLQQALQAVEPWLRKQLNEAR